MGYSLSEEASRVEDKLSAQCVKETGSSNTFLFGTYQYFFEAISHDEGRNGVEVQGTIRRMESDGTASRAGNYRIMSGGMVHTIAPSFKSLCARANVKVKG